MDTITALKSSANAVKATCNGCIENAALRSVDVTTRSEDLSAMMEKHAKFQRSLKLAISALAPRSKECYALVVLSLATMDEYNRLIGVYCGLVYPSRH